MISFSDFWTWVGLVTWEAVNNTYVSKISELVAPGGAWIGTQGEGTADEI
jgi:hypothetical protein